MARTKKQKEDLAIVASAPKIEDKVCSTWNNTESEKPRLSEKQLRLLEVTERDVENSKLQMAVAEQELRNLRLQASYLELAIEKQKLTLNGKSQEYENLKQRYVSISRDVFTEHGIQGDQVSYDSDTGDIIK